MGKHVGDRCPEKAPAQQAGGVYGEILQEPGYKVHNKEDCDIDANEYKRDTTAVSELIH